MIILEAAACAAVELSVTQHNSIATQTATSKMIIQLNQHFSRQGKFIYSGIEVKHLTLRHVKNIIATTKKSSEKTIKTKSKNKQINSYRFKRSI